MPTALLSGVWLIALGAAPVHADPAREPERSVHDASPPDDEPATGRFEIDAGYQPDEGFIAGAAVVQDDLFHTGHGLSLTAELSALRQDFRLRYDARTLGDTDVDAHVELFDHRRSYRTFERHGTGGTIGISRRIGPATRAYLSWRVEQVEVDTELAALAEPGAADPFRGGLVSALRAGIVHDSRPRPWADGTRSELFIERADPRLGSDFDLIRAGGSITHQRRLAGPLTLRLGTTAEIVASPGGLGVPVAERLMLDGHRDVRGYGLGDGGLAYGGTAKLTGRAEIEAPLWPAAGLYGSVFYDAGILRGADAQQSVGVGLIWRSPIGPLRFDFARPLDGEGGVEFLFSLGQSF